MLISADQFRQVGGFRLLKCFVARVGEAAVSEPTDSWLSRRDAAKYLDLSFSTLAHMACRAEGPAYYLIGRSARYLKSDLDAWINACVVKPLPFELQRFARDRRMARAGY